MPKIFITGSNTTKGFVTGSGYISNPARVLIREKDDSLGSYPTLKRMGTSDRLGDIVSSPFRDSAQIFEKIIEDTFNEDARFVSNLNQFAVSPSSAKWLVASREKIRKDITTSVATGKTVGAFVFQGPGDPSGRWIRTQQKVLNPTVQIEVYQGPHDFSFQGLGLSQGSPTDVLKVQTSLNGTSGWTNVYINDYNVSNVDFLDTTNGWLKPFLDANSALRRSNTNLVTQEQRATKTRPSCIVNLSMREFKNHGGSSFYIRIIQDSISGSRKKVWAIGNIKIISRDQNLTYPTLTSESVFDKKIANSSISTPNYLNSSIKASASPIESDVKYNLDNIEILRPFKETRSLNNSNFYNRGVDPLEYPGFSSGLLSKTKIEIDLSTDSEINLGVVNQRPNLSIYSESADVDQPTMCYWNKDLRRWESIGPGFRSNLELGFDMDTQISVITSSILGFSNLGKIATGSGSSRSDSTFNLLDDNVISSYLRPCDTFGFPFSGRYHATSSQYILASDLGITKDFLLEKLVIDYNAKFHVDIEYGKTFRGGNNFQDGVPNYMNATIDQYGYRDLNFFILRQSNFTGETKINVKRLDRLGNDLNFSYIETIPGSYDLDGDGIKETYVEESRDLITYAQTINIISGSGTDQTNGSISFEDIVEKFSDRDNINVYDEVYSGVAQQITSSFRIESKCKSTPILPDNTYVILGQLSSSSDAGAVFTSKQKPGRSTGDLDKDSRGLFNAFTGFDPEENTFEVKTPVDANNAAGGSYVSEVILPKSSNTQLTSPYLIKPTDKLILGWATSIGSDLTQINNINNIYPSTIFGGSKLTLYGSQIKDDKEIHEGSNQNLTSVNINEVIGNDLVVDQFQNATRSELTGSVRDQFNLSLLPGTSNYATFGKNIFTFEQRAKASNQENILTAMNPLNRVGKQIVSIVGNGSTLEQIGLAAIEAFSNCTNARRVFSDAVDKTGEYLTSSSYGTSQAYFIYYLGSGLINNMRSTGSPKYYFNSSNFGQFSDFYQQGRDSKFKTRRTQRVVNQTKEPAIKIDFVKSERSETGLELREFFRVRPSEVDGTSENQFQSSNISLFATASLPFFDDNVVKNRTYQSQQGIVVE